jgi:hypothetical protein
MCNTLRGASLLSIKQNSHRFRIDTNVTVEVEPTDSHFQYQSPPVHTNLHEVYEPVVLRTSRTSQTSVSILSSRLLLRLSSGCLSTGFPIKFCLYFLSVASKVIKRIANLNIPDSITSIWDTTVNQDFPSHAVSWILIITDLFNDAFYIALVGQENDSLIMN